MRKRWFTLAAVLTAVAATVFAPMALAAAPATLQEQPGQVRAAAAACFTQSVRNPYASSGVAGTSDPSTYTSTAWTDLNCSTTSVTIPRGKTALISATLNGELACTGAAGQWCLGRVLIGGVEGFPRAPEPSSVSWAHAGPTGTDWETNTLTRSRLVACPATNRLKLCTIAIQGQTRNHAAGYSFWVDDLSLTALSTNT